MDTGFNFKSPAASAPNRSQPVFLKPWSQTLTSLFSCESPRWESSSNIIPFHLHWKIYLFTVLNLIECLLQLLCQPLLLHLALYILGWFLFLNLMNRTLLFLLFLLGASSRLSAFLNQRKLLHCFGLDFSFKKTCKWFDLLSRPLQTFSMSAIRLFCLFFLNHLCVHWRNTLNFI